MSQYKTVMTTIDDRDVREAVALYLHDAVSEAEAARIAGISRAQLRYYVRTSGVITSASAPANGSESSVSRD